MTSWETVIGLEVHARLSTRTKLFCACPTDFGAPPNTQVCPVCLGYPGTLPVLNVRVLELAARAALAAGCAIQPASVFARKNYFYPDLPKGYQISQYDRPFATGGAIPISTSAGRRSIPLIRIHIEEDAGKLLHEAQAVAPHEAETSRVDLNRAGTPLVEIVSEPAMRSAEEAQAYFSRLRQILMYTGVCDGNMEEGSLRCDANVSVRRSGEPLGTRAEVKNLNSFRFLGRAIEFEVERQIAILESGGSIEQETRLWDAAAGETRSMRSKEEAHDYRYFPDPDLPPVAIDAAWVEQIRETLPPLPVERIDRYARDLGISEGDGEVLVATRELADYFEATARLSGNPRGSANWVRNEVLRLLNESKVSIDDFRVTPDMLAELIGLVDKGTIGGRAAKEVFEEMAASGGRPSAIVEARGLSQVSDPEAIRHAARLVLEAHAAQVAQYRSGKTTVFGFLVGQLMKQMRGKARADLANEIMRELLDPPQQA